MKTMPLFARVVAWGLALVVAVVASEARADKPAPLSAQTLKAPKGPSSLRGLGESFSANPSTGTGSTSVPISLPPGLVTPKLALSYVGGSGRAELGVGFTLPLLQIYRQTDKAAPKFDETDRFAVTGPEYNDELVLVDASRRLYRLKNETSFVLFQRDSTNDRWIVMHPNGLKSTLGQTVAARGQAAGKTTRWFVETTSDAFAHQALYRYWKDQGKVYLKGIDYQQEAATAYRNRVELEYEARPDVLRDYRYGDLEQTASRCTSIQIFQGPRSLRRYSLIYDPNAIYSVLTEVRMEGENGLTMPVLRFGYLSPSSRSGRFVKMEGFASLAGLDTGRVTLEDVNADGLPDLLTGSASNYSYAENVDGVRFASPSVLGSSGSPDRDLDAPGVVLADVDGDGHRDVWYPIGDGRFRFFPGGKVSAGRFLGFGAAQVMNGNGVVTDVTRPEIRLTDLNGDGKTDLLYQRVGVGDLFVENQLARDFVQRAIPALPSGLRLDSANVELVDFNGDGPLDLVLREFDGGKHNLKIWYGTGGGKFVATARDWAAPAAGAKEVFLSDVNRDGQVDLVRVSGSWVAYYLNDGRSGFLVRHGDFSGMPETARTRKLLFADMNGNGTTDVVWLTVDGALSYLDLMGEPNVGLLSRMDNGMGMVTDIGYRSSTDYMVEAKLRGTPWRTPLPHPVPVISEVRTSDSLETLGVQGWESRQTFDYSEGYYDGKEREFRGFARVIETAFGDDSQETQVSELRMHVGRNLDTGADEEVLKGKVWLEVTKGANGQVISSDEHKWELRWLCQEELGAGAATVLPACTGIADKQARKDDLVALVVETGLLHGAWERQATPRYAAKKTDYDSFGNATRLEEYGEVALAAGHQLGDAWAFNQVDTTVGADEKLTETDYANRIDVTTGAWVIGYPYEERTKAIDGTLVGRMRTYYDGDAFVGLPLGQVTRGLISKREVWLAEESRWVPAERRGYNADGLPTNHTDATGYATTIAYDTQALMFATEERIQLEGARVAVFGATYDRGYGAPLTMTDPNGRVTQYKYDGLGRLTQIIDPLSSLAEPTAIFSYAYGTPQHPISLTTVQQLAARGRGVYRTSLQYSDGLARPRLVKTMTENGYIGTGWQTFSARGEATTVYESFTSSHGELEEPPPGTPLTLTLRDAAGRPTYEYLPPTADNGASYKAHEYYPFETRDYDERDATEGTFAYPTVSRVDGLGRVRSIKNRNFRNAAAVDLEWTLRYDTKNQLTSFKDPRGFERTFRYDSLGRLTRVGDPNLGAVTYAYDDEGRLTKRVDALNRESISEYGLAGRLKRVLLRTPSGPGFRVDAEYLYHYDDPRSPTPLANPSDLVGRLSWVESPTGTEHYGYDPNGLLRQQAVELWDGVSPVTAQVRTTHVRTSAYDATGAETARQLPGEFSLATDYDARGLVARVSGGLPEDSREILKNAVYDQRGELNTVEHGNGLRQCRNYDARGRLTTVLLAKTAETTCTPADLASPGLGAYHVSYRWGYDDMLGSTTDLSRSRIGTLRLDASYGYDRLHQLTSVVTPTIEYGYGYDDTQNLTTRTRRQGTQPVVTESLVYGEAAGPNALTHVGSTGLTYDAAGQLQRYNGYDLSFDPAGRLIEANKAGARRIQFFYDAFGERKLLVTTPAGGSAQVYRYPIDGYSERAGDAVWSMATAVADVEVRRAKGLAIDAALLDELTSYVNAPLGKPKPLPAEWMDLDGDGDGFDAGDLAEAQRAFWDARLAGTARVTWRYTHGDHLKSSVLVTDRAGDDVATRRYEPYGVLAQRSGTQPTRGYGASEIDPDTELGLVRMGARYFAPALGRWVTPDRFIGESPERIAKNPLESNLYSYAVNNPIAYRDPTGELGLDSIAVGVAKKAAKWLAKKGANVSAHIAKRHIAKRIGKSTFKEGGKEVKKLIERGLKQWDRVADQGRRLVFERRFDRAIGTGGEQILRVVVDKATGKIVTAFPTAEFKALMTAGIIGTVATASSEADAAIVKRRETIAKAMEPGFLEEAVDFFVGVSTVARDEDILEEERMVERRINETISKVQDQEQRSLDDKTREAIRETFLLNMNVSPGDNPQE